MALSLLDTVLPDVVHSLDFSAQPPALVQSLAEKSLAAVVALHTARDSEADIERLRRLLPL